MEPEARERSEQQPENDRDQSCTGGDTDGEDNGHSGLGRLEAVGCENRGEGRVLIDGKLSLRLGLRRASSLTSLRHGPHVTAQLQGELPLSTVATVAQREGFRSSAVLTETER